MTTGTVKFYQDKEEIKKKTGRGHSYGFITPDPEPGSSAPVRDVFVDVKDVAAAGLASLKEGARVEFTAVAHPRDATRVHATNLKILKTSGPSSQP